MTKTDNGALITGNQPAPAVDTAQVVIKDHQIRELINELRGIAIKHHVTGSLREKIAHTVHKCLREGAKIEIRQPTIGAETQFCQPPLDVWIKCSERMPDIGQGIIFFSDGIIHGIWDGEWWQQDNEYGVETYNTGYLLKSLVSHWMPLPAAPQQEV
ncbi:DUF551 domain-containing protein [Scandinavium goeteborgense]|uniref:DUF551 domain-containing protein n=1 Tax=Scandinavium goeteborgense TaxID=1851514 RepID=UPI002165FDE6|nr:DUF551 domain-containing protein [Scandinavium goeteborgense]MCS2154732.1 DUF551 domain-containing protein [Scandinavium goeteborgense]